MKLLGHIKALWLLGIVLHVAGAMTFLRWFSYWDMHRSGPDSLMCLALVLMGLGVAVSVAWAAAAIASRRGAGDANKPGRISNVAAGFHLLVTAPSVVILFVSLQGVIGEAARETRERQRLVEAY